MEATDLREGCTLVVLCCVTVVKLVLHEVLAIDSSISAIRTLRQRDQQSQTTTTQSNVKPLTTAVNSLFTADAKNSLVNPVSTPSSTR